MPEPFPQKLRVYVDSQEWVFASTYAKTWPHEYLLRAKCTRPWIFHKVVDHIWKHGAEGRFWKRKETYFSEGGWVYWAMGRGGKADIINRCRENQTFEWRIKNDPASIFARHKAAFDKEGKKLQTFVPMETYGDSARVLDRQRLGKQRSECKQILRALLGETKGWKNHPAVKMWKNREIGLVQYAIAICLEWQQRGYKDTLLDYFIAMLQKLRAKPDADQSPMVLPAWWGCPIHESHRLGLMAAKPDHYLQFGWELGNGYQGLVWPRAGDSAEYDLTPVRRPRRAPPIFKSSTDKPVIIDFYEESVDE